MPFGLEHSARQRPVATFATLVRRAPDGWPRGVEATFGRRKDDGTEDLQSVAFDAGEWSPEDALEFLRKQELATLGLYTAPEGCGTIRFDEGLPSELPLTLVRRIDFHPLDLPEVTESGFLRGQGIITRAGVFTYQTNKGDTVRELRAPVEVFKKDSIESFHLAPLTVDHPTENVEPLTYNLLAAGAVGMPQRVGQLARADILICRQDALDAVKNGKNGLSCGYTCQVIAAGGVYIDPEGQEHRFDAMQTHIIGNHVALCDNPRAGPTAHFRIDADGEIRLDVGEAMKKKVTLKGGTSVEVEESEIPKLRADGMLEEKSPKDTAPPGKKAEEDEDEDDPKKAKDTMPPGLYKEKEDAIARADKAEAEAAVLRSENARLKKAEKKDAESELVKRRVQLCTRAAAALRLDNIDELVGMSPREVMLKVLGEKTPDVDLSERSDEAVEGAFEIVMAGVSGSSDTSSKIADGFKGKPKRGDSTGDPAADARRRMIERKQDAWKPKAMRKKETA